MTGLNGKYLSDFEEVKKYIEKFSAKGTERDEAIESLSAIYFEAQENGAEILEIHEDSAENYAAEICEGLPKKKHINKKPIFAAVGAVLAVILFIAGYFTSDRVLMKKGGYGYMVTYPEKFNVVNVDSGQDNMTGKFTVNEFSTAETDETLANLGIICEDYSFYIYDEEFEDTKFSMQMVSKIKPVSDGFLSVRTPVQIMLGKNGEIELFGEIKAYINGLEYTGAITEYDISGRDLKYIIDFTASGEGDYNGNIGRLISGDYVTVCFESAKRITWSYIGEKETLKKGMLPFFVPYSVEKEPEPVESIEYSEETSDGSVMVIYRTYYDKELGGQKMSFASVPRKLSDKVDYAITREPYLDEKGFICIDVDIFFKDGTKSSETLSFERKTELVFSSYKGYMENADISVSMYAKRDKSGKFISVENFAYGEKGDYHVAWDYDENWEITEEGDVMAEIFYYHKDSDIWNDEAILSETVFFDHSIY